MADLALCFIGADKFEPVTGRTCTVGRSQYFANVAVTQVRCEFDHSAVHFCAYHLVAYCAVNGVSKKSIGFESAGSVIISPLGGRNKYLIRKGVYFERLDKVVVFVDVILNFREVCVPTQVFESISAEALSPDLYFQCAAIPISAIRCISSVLICISKICPFRKRSYAGTDTYSVSALRYSL